MFRYYVFYKPFQVLSQFSRDGEKKTFADYFPTISKDIYPVGRLDYDSEGLILLTNDKDITYRLLEPKFKHSRTYFVQVEGIPSDDSLAFLSSGIDITVNGKQYTTLPARVTVCANQPAVPPRDPPIRFRKNVPTTWLELTIAEGKNRQVRKMTAAVGLPTLRLIRYSIGDVSIAGINPGEYRELLAAEIKSLFSRAK
jgi:23S rRNA pseudouridine2457 synthase